MRNIVIVDKALSVSERLLVAEKLEEFAYEIDTRMLKRYGLIFVDLKPEVDPMSLLDLSGVEHIDKVGVRNTKEEFLK